MTNANLIEQLRQRYNVGPRFAEACLRHFSLPGESFASLDEMMALPAPRPMWIDFAASCVNRGRALRDRVSPVIGRRRGRHLDVGCGYGGMLVAFAEIGFEVRGFDIMPVLVPLAKANCADFELGDVVTIGDVLDPDFMAMQGSFDLITLVDVIEHVDHVPRTLDALVEALKPGGFLMFEIPNKDFLPWIGRDGHYALFGITQLERERAGAYHQQIFGDPYGVGEYYELEQYLDWLRERGCVTCVLDSMSPPLPMADWPGLMRAVLDDFDRYRNEFAARLEPETERDAREVAFEFLGRFFTDLARENEPVSQRFQRRYLQDFWLIVAQKPAA